MEVKRGTCTNCGKNYTFSIGRVRIPLLRQSEANKQNILDWFKQSSECYSCNPVPKQYQSQAGTILHREF